MLLFASCSAFDFYDVFFCLDKESISISPDGGGVDVIVYSNHKWEISGASEWCTPSVKSGKANADGQKVTFTADVAYDDREAIFWFRCADEKIKFTVSQQFKEAIIPDENNTLHIPAEGGVATLAYQTTVDCEVIIPEDAKDWISIASANTRGLVAENINLDIAENTTYSARSAVVKVVMIGNESIVAEYTIKQAQVDAVIADGENTFNVSSLGGDVTIKYQTNVECEVQIPEEAQEWIAIVPATTRALVQESTQLHIAANDTGQDRSAIVKVVANGNQDILAEYTITQYGDVLYYTSVDGEIVTPYDSEAFGATILSNTYSNGMGIIKFNRNITSIGGSAFRYCESLQSITIPESVTSIGKSAFYYCSSLASVTIGDSVTEIGEWAFEGCSSLASITIPESVTSIGWGAFSGCTGELIINSKIVETDYTSSSRPSWGGSFSKLTIGDSVTSIGDYAFYSRSTLQSITIPNSVTSIGEGAFYGCSSLQSITIPDSVTSIGNYAFQNCSSLQNVIIPDGVTPIGEGTFSGCRSLQSITIPESVTSIGDYAFQNCSSLQSITIPDSVTSIGNLSFYGCTGELIINSKIVETDYYNDNYPQKYGWLEGAQFSKLTIGNSVTSIGMRAFYGCLSLKSITIPESVTEIEMYAFYGCSSLVNITIPDSVTSIGGSAFFGCSSLQSITIPESVTEIETFAFEGCSSLQSVTIGNRVTSIGLWAFEGCSSLKSVTIPDSVTSIGYEAFSGCSSLKSVYCKPTTPPSGDSNMFDNNASGRKIYVPRESVEAYETARFWINYKSYIYGYDF